MPKISARIRSFFGPKGRKSKGRSRGRKSRRSSEPVVGSPNVNSKTTKVSQESSKNSPRVVNNASRPSSPLANPQTDSKPSILAKVENSDSGWLVVDKDRDIMIENPEIQSSESLPSYYPNIARSRSAATTPRSRGSGEGGPLHDTDFVLPSKEQTTTRLLLVPGTKAHSHTCSSSVPSSPVLSQRAASLPPKIPAASTGDARSMMLQALLPDVPKMSIRNAKSSSRSASLAPTSPTASDAATAVAATTKPSALTPMSSLHGITTDGRGSTTPSSHHRRLSSSMANAHSTHSRSESLSNAQVHHVESASLIGQQIRVVVAEEDFEEEDEGEEDDVVDKLSKTLHKFNLRCEDSPTADRLVEEEIEGREGNSGTSGSEKRFTCHICQNGFKFKRSLTRHMKSTHEGGFGTCRVCGDVNFSQKVSYEKHLQKSQKHLRKLWELISSRDPSRRKTNYVIGGEADPARAKFDRVKLDASLRELGLDHLEGIIRRITVPPVSANPFKPELGFLRQCPICNIIFQNDREFIRHCASHEESLDRDDPRLADLAGNAAGPGASTSRSRSREIDRHLSVNRSPNRDRSRSPIRSRGHISRSASSEVDPAFRGARGDSPLSVHADDISSNNVYAAAMAGGHPSFRSAQSVSLQSQPQLATGFDANTGLPQRIRSTFSDTLPLELTGAGTSSMMGSPAVSADPTLSLTSADYSLTGSGTAGAMSLGSGDGISIKGEYDMLLAGGGTTTAVAAAGLGASAFSMTDVTTGLDGLGGSRRSARQQSNIALVDPRFVVGAPLAARDAKPLINAHDLNTDAVASATSPLSSQPLPSMSLPHIAQRNATQTGGLTLGFTSTALQSQSTQHALSLSQTAALGNTLPQSYLSAAGLGFGNSASLCSTHLASVGTSISSSVGASTAPPVLPRQNSLSSNQGLPPPNFRVPSTSRSQTAMHADVQALYETFNDSELMDDDAFDDDDDNPLLKAGSDPMLPTSSVTSAAMSESAVYNDAVFNTSASASAVLGGLQTPTVGGGVPKYELDLDHSSSHFLKTAQLHPEGSVSRTIKLDLLTRAAARERSKKQLLDTKANSSSPSEVSNTSSVQVSVVKKEKENSSSSLKK